MEVHVDARIVVALYVFWSVLVAWRRETNVVVWRGKLDEWPSMVVEFHVGMVVRR